MAVPMSSFSFTPVGARRAVLGEFHIRHTDYLAVVSVGGEGDDWVVHLCPSYQPGALWLNETRSARVRYPKAYYPSPGLAAMKAMRSKKAKDLFWMNRVDTLMGGLSLASKGVKLGNFDIQITVGEEKALRAWLQDKYGPFKRNGPLNHKKVFEDLRAALWLLLDPAHVYKKESV